MSQRRYYHVEIQKKINPVFWICLPFLWILRRFPFVFVRYDLTEFDLIKTIVDPYIDSQDLIVQGSTLKRSGIRKIRITSTNEKRSNEIAKFSKGLEEFTNKYDVIRWSRNYHTFNHGADYTPYFLGVYPNSAARQKVKEIFAQIGELEVERMDLEDEEEIQRVNTQITQLMAKIAYVIGSFIRGFMEAKTF